MGSHKGLIPSRYLRSEIALFRHDEVKGLIPEDETDALEGYLTMAQLKELRAKAEREGREFWKDVFVEFLYNTHPEELVPQEQFSSLAQEPPAGAEGGKPLEADTKSGQDPR